MSQFLTGQQTITTTAAPLNGGVATNFSTGIKLTCLSTSTNSIFLGASNAVTTSTGDELPPGSSVILPLYDLSTIYAIAAGSTRLTWMGIF